MAMIGARIKQVRLQRGWSQARLADHTGIKREHISRLENGHNVPTVGTMQRIARVLGISLAQLLTDKTGGGQNESGTGTAKQAL
jgi:transcriptional regulator with XRE-family HTH domain